MKRRILTRVLLKSLIVFSLSVIILYLLIRNMLCTVVSDNINIMKTTFELNFDFYQAFKQHGYTNTWKQIEAVNLKSFTLITCKLVIRKKLVNN